MPEKHWLLVNGFIVGDKILIVIPVRWPQAKYMNISSLVNRCSSCRLTSQKIVNEDGFTLWSLNAINLFSDGSSIDARFGDIDERYTVYMVQAQYS
jgi:hypothetical protein